MALYPAKLKNHEFLPFAVRLAKKAGDMLKKRQATAKIVKRKSVSDYALDTDIASENLIINTIKKKFPHHDFFAEESGKTKNNSDYVWVIDPLEGTINYKNKTKLYAVNIALYHKDKPLVAVVYIPEDKEMFCAAAGKGSYLNGKRIRVSNESNINNVLHGGSVEDFRKIKLNRHLMRGLGSGGIHVAYVACGRFGSDIPKPHADPYGNGVGLLVTEAGGKITDTKGKQWHFTTKRLLFSNGKLHKKLLNLLK